MYQSYCIFSAFLFNFILCKTTMLANKREIFQIVFKCGFLKPEQYELAWHHVTKLLRNASYFIIINCGKHHLETLFLHCYCTEFFDVSIPFCIFCKNNQ